MKQRVFLAINLPQNTKKKIANLSLTLKKKLPKRGVKFVEKNRHHITLHFLGEQPKHKVKEIENISEKIAKNYSGFEIVINRLDAFPNKKFPRILVLKAENKNKELGALRSELYEALTRLNINIDARPWQEHITLARIKFGKINFERLLQEDVGEFRFMAQSFELIESRLTNEGPIYKILKSFSFKF